jgi:hypothetical protein
MEERTGALKGMGSGVGATWGEWEVVGVVVGW